MAKVGKVVTVAVSGIALFGAIAAVGIFTLNDAGATSISEENVRYYQGRFYDRDGSCIYETELTRRGDPLFYPPTEYYETTYYDYDDGSLNSFIGWDYTGDGLADILGDRMYFNFDAKTVYAKTPSMEQLEIDPETLSSLTEMILENLINSGVLEDFEINDALYETIVSILEYLVGSGLDLSSIDVNLLQELLDKLDISLEELCEMFNLDLETLLGIFNSPAFEYTASDWTTPHFFRTTSKGDYKKGKWTNPDFYSRNNISEGALNPLEYAFDKISKMVPLVQYDFTYVKKGKYYPTPVYELGNVQNLDSDSFSLQTPYPEPTEDNKNRSTYSTYGYGFYPASSYSILISKMSDYSSEATKEDEIKYREYVRENYLNIDKEYKDYLLDFATEHEIVVDYDTYSHVSKINELFKEWKMQDFTMELESYPKNEDRVKYFIEHPEIGGRSGDFATVTTLLYRALGVPARYVTGYFDINLEQEPVRVVGGLQAHDWVEIYIDNLGWMMADTSISSALPEGMSELLFGSPEVDMGNELGELDHIEATLEQTEFFTNNVIDPYKIKIEAVYTNKQSFDIKWHIPEDYDPEEYNVSTVMPQNIVCTNEKNINQTLHIFVPATNVEGDFKIKVFFNDKGIVKVDTIPIKIIEPKIVSLTVNPLSYQDIYLQGSDIDLSTMIIRAEYNDPSKEPLDLSYNSSLLITPEYISSSTVGKYNFEIYLSEDIDVKTTFEITIIDSFDHDSITFSHFTEQSYSSESNPYEFIINQFDPYKIPLEFHYIYRKVATVNGSQQARLFNLTSKAPSKNGAFTYVGDVTTPGIRQIDLIYSEPTGSSEAPIYVRFRDANLSLEITNFKEYDGKPFSEVEILKLHELKENDEVGEDVVLEQNEHVEYRVSENFNDFYDAKAVSANIEFRIFNDEGEIITSRFFEDSTKTDLTYYKSNHEIVHEELHFHEEGFDVDSEGWLDLGYFDFTIGAKDIVVETYDTIYQNGLYTYFENTQGSYSRLDTVNTAGIELVSGDYIDWDNVTFTEFTSTTQKVITNGIQNLKIYSGLRTTSEGTPLDVTENYHISYKFGKVTRA